MKISNLFIIIAFSILIIWNCTEIDPTESISTNKVNYEIELTDSLGNNVTGYICYLFYKEPEKLDANIRKIYDDIGYDTEQSGRYRITANGSKVIKKNVIAGVPLLPADSIDIDMKFHIVLENPQTKKFYRLKDCKDKKLTIRKHRISKYRSPEIINCSLQF